VLTILPLLAAAAAASPPADASDWRLVNPRAIELFEADTRLMDWALARYDENHDGYLSIMEADDAATEFKSIADADRNGQVTPAEYREARAFIVARWAVSEQASRR
jgi:hypothetical protein